ncbi:unnamed protein product [Gordionus sp. m RMFG-2023]
MHRFYIVLNSFFEYTASPLCCPSRASILTGLYVHNHNVVNNSREGQCSGTEWRATIEKRHTYPLYLKRKGYDTFYMGKYLNEYGVHNEKDSERYYIPDGWTNWFALAGNSRYYNYTISNNGKPRDYKDNYEKDYLPNVLKKKAITYIKKRFSSEEKPENGFIMTIGLPSPHEPWDYAPQYKNKFLKKSVPKFASFNNITTNPRKHWIVRQAMNILSNKTVVLIDEIFRKRWRTLLTVDNIFSAVVKACNESDILDSTYFIFTSDNGYHLGQFGLPYDKRQPYEFDIKIPLMISGPGVTQTEIHKIVSNIDLAPTMLEMANIEYEKDKFDGVSLLSLARANKPPKRNSILIEHSGEYKPKPIHGCPQYGNNSKGLSMCDIDCVCQESPNNAYTCIRTISNEKDDIYCDFYKENLAESYDLIKDPFQLNNLANPKTSHNLQQIKFINKFKRCHGIRCHKFS